MRGKIVTFRRFGSSCGSSPDAPVSLHQCLNSGHPEKNQLSACLGWVSAEDENGSEWRWLAQLCALLSHLSLWAIQLGGISVGSFGWFKMFHVKLQSRAALSSLVFSNTLYLLLFWLCGVNKTEAEESVLTVINILRIWCFGGGRAGDFWTLSPPHLVVLEMLAALSD